MADTLPSFTDARDACASLHARWRQFRALRGDDVPKPTELADLDGDSVHAIAAALPLGVPFMNDACLDRRSPSLGALASTCKLFHQCLKAKTAPMRKAHFARCNALAALCSESLHPATHSQLRCASLAAAWPGEAACACCGEAFRRSGGLFLRARRPDSIHGLHDSSAAEAIDPWLCCAHCWRESLEGLSMRPSPFGAVEQLWEAPIEDGTYRMVEDFTNCREIFGGPLLTREEVSSELFSTLDEAVVPEEVVAAVAMARRDAAAAGILLEYRRPLHRRLWWERDEDDERPPAPPPPPHVLAALPPMPLDDARVLADLIAAGHAEHVTALDLTDSGLTDDGLRLLTRALTGTAPHLQFLGLNGNDLTGHGVGDFADALRTPPPRRLMLPSLRWLHLVVTMPGDAGADALARALHRGALPSLEILWACTDDDFDEQGVGLVDLALVCTLLRGVLLEIGRGGGVGQGAAELLAALEPDVRERAFESWADASHGLSDVD